eukprot:GHVR01090014.1.p2 GENE.GHVR01090014.1~~GHVR01090014.1.p2  ORF type:complete len:108 (+),score=10.08 GHVR01090014.1:454-777(+)
MCVRTSCIVRQDWSSAACSDQTCLSPSPRCVDALASDGIDTMHDWTYGLVPPKNAVGRKECRRSPSRTLLDEDLSLQEDTLPCDLKSHSRKASFHCPLKQRASTNAF